VSDAERTAVLVSRASRQPAIARPKVGPFIALVELYRRWDLTDAAVATAKQGVTTVTGDASDVWFELGVVLWDKRADAEAIDALSKAIELRPDNLKARFQRGQTYFRIHQKAKAKADLEVIATSTDPNVSFERGIAQKLLLDLSAKP
jgi:tetratricopeptide (TPR) repeat protein